MFSTVMVRREKDARFARVHTDPRFHRPRKDDTKVVLDERFKDVLTKGPKQLDRFGRKRHDTREAQDLERLYRLDSDADYARGEVELESSSEEDDDDEEEEEDDDEEEDLIGQPIPAAMAFLGLGFIACTLLVAGMPPLSGFVGKLAMLSALVERRVRVGYAATGTPSVPALVERDHRQAGRVPHRPARCSPAPRA